MSAQTAKLEVLTATVRVLMVGSRQVTLSVYRQLDAVSREAMEPFGRINDDRNDGLWLVGENIETGDLVRARSDAVPVNNSPEEYAHLSWNHWLQGRFAGERLITEVVARDGDTGEYVEWRVPNFDNLDRRHYKAKYPCCGRDSDMRHTQELVLACEGLASRQLLTANNRGINARFINDLARPLIVLAGLR